MCVCGWFTSSRFGHIRYQLLLVHWHWWGSTTQFLLMELILGMPTYIVLDFTLLANNVFSIYLGPSIVKLCTDHILSSTIISVSLVLICYMLVLLYAWQFIRAHVFCTCALYGCHSLPGLYQCNQQCPLADH